MRQGDQQQANGQGGENVMEEEIPEFVGSDVVTRNSRVISQNIAGILADPDASQWDNGLVVLADSYQFNLWSDINPEPVNRPNETMEAFTARQRAARLDRINLLANRAQRTINAQKAHDDAFPPPPSSSCPSPSPTLFLDLGG